jgi:hypothetical protein
VAGPVHAVSVGIGGFGGVSFPIIQDDNSTGAQFGVRVPVNFMPLVTLEPYFAHSSLGEASQTFAGLEYTREGFGVNAFGVNVMLGGAGLVGGFPFYPYAGIGTHKLSRDGSDDISEVGYNFGLGLGFSLPPGLSINVRGELNMVQTGDTSRKFVNGTVGVSYKLPILP